MRPMPWTGKTIEKWQKWRDADHEDNAVIGRTDVCTLLDEIYRLRKLVSDSQERT